MRSTMGDNASGDDDDYSEDCNDDIDDDDDDDDGYTAIMMRSASQLAELPSSPPGQKSN